MRARNYEKEVEDETKEHEKFSKKKLWGEQVRMPVATRFMSIEKIEEFRQDLADSYNVDVKEIIYEFYPIKDVNDSDRLDCINLKYFLKKPKLYMNEDGVTAREEIIHCEIYTLKMPVPPEMRNSAMARTKGTIVVRNATPQQKPSVNVNDIPQSRRKPMRRV